MKIEVEGRLIETRSETAQVELWYPRNPESAKAVEIGLMDVRAADSIKVEYDFERDGWVIKQAGKFEWDATDEVCDPDWQEVAFIQAWARDKRDS